MKSEDQVEMLQTAPSHSSVVDQSHLQLDADQSGKAWDFTVAAIRYGREKERERCAGIAEMDSILCWVGGSTGSAKGTANNIASAIRSNSITQDSASASELSTDPPESQRPETDYTPLVEIDANGNVVPVTRVTTPVVEENQNDQS